jgi:CTP synthase
MMILGESGDYDIVITELGGTVGDIESLPYVESVRQLKRKLGHDDSLVIHLTLVPYLSAAGELKTKPTQHSVQKLLEAGVQPDILVCRTEHKLNLDVRKKISLFCNVNLNAVIESIDVETIYDVPLMMEKEKLDKVVLSKLRLPGNTEPKMDKWKDFLFKLKHPKHEVNIGLVGKYVELQDAYKSINEAFIHAGATNECKVNLVSLHSENINADNVKSRLRGLDGVLVAPGFGDRGIEGKIATIKYLREKNIPFFGICLGMQCAVIEFARNVLGLKGAHSTEMDAKTKAPVIDLMEDQKKVSQKGGTMRLGAYKCELKKGSKAAIAYGKTSISERHRHRYEFNNDYSKDFKKAGMKLVGINPQTKLVEVVELPDHPWFVAVQYHPELKSTVDAPHPLFVRFVKAAIENK